MYGERIKQLRLGKNWTQEELGNKTKCSRRMINSFENEKREPSIDKIIAFSQVFEVSTDFILGVETKSQNYKYIKAENSQLKNLLNDIYKNNEKMKLKIKNFLP